MFEKEADYRLARTKSKSEITKVIHVWSAREETLHDAGFQKGVEFGYNKENNELNKENGKLEGFLEDERMEYCELENFKNNEIKELKDKVKKIIKELMYFCKDYTTIGIPEENRSINSKKVCKQVEDFLKELEK